MTSAYYRVGVGTSREQQLNDLSMTLCAGFAKWRAVSSGHRVKRRTAVYE
jgi:hypothetical protein